MQNARIFCPASRAEWRQWLSDNHSTEAAVWLVYYKKKSPLHNLAYSDAVDEALCFGWIDSKILPIDSEKYQQFFCPRKPKSVWSRVNKQKIEKLAQAELMHESGWAVVEIAKNNGSWESLDAVENLEYPTDLQAFFEQNPALQTRFETQARSQKKMFLQGLHACKRPATRAKKISALFTLLQA